MEQKNLIINKSNESNISPKTNPVSVNANEVSNVLLKRLIEEVQYESQNNISAYNRSHNRHNRGR